LCTTSLGKSKPKDEDELECVVEWEPVDSIDGTLKDSEESKHNPVCKPLSVVGFAHAEESLERIVTRDNESSKIGQQLSSDIEEDEEEVDSDKPEEAIDLGKSGLLLKVIQDLILGKLLINCSNVVLGLILKTRHDEDVIAKLEAEADGLECGYCEYLKRTSLSVLLLDK